MQALQNLPGDSLSRNPGCKEHSQPVQNGRAKSVISDVLSKLAPLVNRPQEKQLQTDILEVSNAAIDVWNEAQTGDLKITVSKSLDYPYREEWQSQEFDAVTTNNDGATSDAVSRTRPRIFTLFPRIIAREVAVPVQHDTEMPGSFPQGAELLHHTIETLINPGEGLPESSALVVRGKEKQEQRDKFIAEEIEKIKKQGHNVGHGPGHSRREPRTSLASSLPSPTEQLNIGGAMNVPERVGAPMRS